MAPAVGAGQAARKGRQREAEQRREAAEPGARDRVPAYHPACYTLPIVYRRTPSNIERLADSLAPHHPYLRGAPPGLPFRLDSETIRRGLNFTLVTDLGDLDLLGEISGCGAGDRGRRCPRTAVSIERHLRSLTRR